MAPSCEISYYLAQYIGFPWMFLLVKQVVVGPDGKENVLALSVLSLESTFDLSILPHRTAYDGGIIPQAGPPG